MITQCRALVFMAILICGEQGNLLWAGDTETWPQWRGPQRNGRVDGRPWPTGLQEPKLTLSWHRELPPSYSGPVVSADKVFVTYTQEEKNEGVRALDRQTGKENWRAEWEGGLQVAPLGPAWGVGYGPRRPMMMPDYSSPVWPTCWFVWIRIRARNAGEPTSIDDTGLRSRSSDSFARPWSATTECMSKPPTLLSKLTNRPARVCGGVSSVTKKGVRMGWDRDLIRRQISG